MANTSLALSAAMQVCTGLAITCAAEMCSGSNRRVAVATQVSRRVSREHPGCRPVARKLELGRDLRCLWRDPGGDHDGDRHGGRTARRAGLGLPGPGPVSPVDRAVGEELSAHHSHGDWTDLGGTDEQKPAKDGTAEAWGRSPKNPVGGWYGLKKGLRGRFGVYVPPLIRQKHYLCFDYAVVT